MADQQKGKNRAAILQELESIKGLLVDEEDIPVLQEVIDSAEAHLDEGESLDDEELQELQQAYRDLLQAQEELVDETEAASETPAPTADETPVRTEVQTSLFDDDVSQPEDEPDASFGAPSTEASASKPEATKAPSNESRSATSRRPGVTKATGENPFLPAHIRARLHGNRPPPLFEPLTPMPTPTNQASKVSAPADRVSRALVTDALVNEFLPQIEAALRHRLKAMTDEQLRQLSSENTLSNNEEDDSH